MIDYLADLESDFSRFHRVDDIYQLDGPRFMRLAWRIGVYDGVIAMRLREQTEAERSAETPARRAGAATSPAGRGGADGGVKPLAAAAATFPDLFDVRRA